MKKKYNKIGAPTHAVSISSFMMSSHNNTINFKIIDLIYKIHH